MRCRRNRFIGKASIRYNAKLTKVAGQLSVEFAAAFLRFLLATTFVLAGFLKIGTDRPWIGGMSR
jgi:hypothetical protein